MLDRIQAFLHTLTAPHHTDEFAPDDPRVAFVALCFQVMEADGNMSVEEQQKFRDLMRDRYDLSPEGLQSLIEAGRQAGSEAVDYYRFTSDLRKHLVDEEDRIELLGILWDIVYADGQRSEIEDHVIWRIADLLGVSARDRVLQRQEAAARTSAHLVGGEAEEQV
ncbi:TerB family tellurite resistance protein [Rhizobium sp. CFBP 13726]|uniref:tellurite resistance TerB family protein n=1 Tax=Rhizobium sp. CFBP 13726 TaxID=2775296 RepID=UPI00177B04E5|nr:TerB family tellurite resistance protein [Rhizobium sp. CFBP 13726]MBD8652026.1 TerB family tellurite resistance protein [Rhizobium sp. CFBP 13726]